VNKFAKMVSVAALAVGGTLAAGAVQAADVSFMSFTYAEEANTKTVQGVLDAFKTADGLTVEPLGFAWGDMQKNIFLRARSKSLPDIAQLSERWLPTFASLDTLVDLNTVYGKEKLEAAFAPDALAMGNIDGKQYALPLISGTIGMVANKEVLEKAGVSKAPETLQEFKDALVAVRDKVPNSVPYTMATKNNGSILIDFMLWNWVHGGRIINDEGKVVVDSDAGRAALQFMVDLVKDRLAAPEIDRPDSRRLMAQGASAFYFDAPQTRTFLRDFSGKGVDFDKNVLPMTTPVLKQGDKPVSVQWGHLLVQFAPGATAASDAPADKFLAYLTSDVVQTDYPLKMSALPVTKSAREAVSGDAYLAAWSKATGDARRNEVGIWSNAAELTQIVGEEAQAAMLGQKSADDAIKTMQGRLTESMASAKKAN
jgi:multiple sugar transport system substrate-binding protein